MEISSSAPDSAPLNVKGLVASGASAHFLDLRKIMRRPALFMYAAKLATSEITPTQTNRLQIEYPPR